MADMHSATAEIRRGKKKDSLVVLHVHFIVNDVFTIVQMNE